MKLTIDEKVCAKHKLSLNEVLTVLVAGRTEDFQKTLDDLVKREVLVYQDNKYFVTQHWNDEIEDILADSIKPSEITEERLRNLATKMRDAYQSNAAEDILNVPKKLSSSGDHYRSSTAEVMNRLKKFFNDFGDYSDEDILDAEKRYLKSFRGNYQYLKLLKYFIWKKDSDFPTSLLADFLENKDDDASVSAAEDWTSNIRN